MLDSGTSRRLGRCERNCAARTSVTQVAREMCALDGAVQTSRKVSRTLCYGGRWRRVGRNKVAHREVVRGARSDGGA